MIKSEFKENASAPRCALQRHTATLDLSHLGWLYQPHGHKLYAKQWKQLFQCGRWKSVSLEEKEKFLDPFPGDTNFKTSYRGILHGDELVK